MKDESGETLMRKIGLVVLCVMLLAAVMPAQADVGRDVLMVYRTVNNWTQEDLVIILTADGNRLVFGLDEVPHEIRNDDAELLFFLRTHALSEGTMLYGAAAPVALVPMTQEQADAVRALLGKVQVVPFEETPHLMDGGDFLTYAVVRVDGEATLALLARGGNLKGMTSDPAALALLNLAGPWIMDE